jgi:6-phosphogluconolactonase (cycloisomerase 2 family)
MSRLHEIRMNRLNRAFTPAAFKGYGDSLGMKSRAFPSLTLFAAMLCCHGCSNNNNTLTSTQSVGDIFVATAGNTAVQAYGVTLSSGALSADGPGIQTGTGVGSSPTAMAISPDATTLVIANSSCSSAATGCLTLYTIAGDGSLTAVTGTVGTGVSPIALAFNPAGTFLFVANQGDSTVSAYSVSGTTLTQVPGSPFSTVTPGVTTPTLPSGLAVSASGNFLYVSNSLTYTVSVFNVGSNGALAQSTNGPYSVGTNPGGLGITPTGAFLYVSNFHDNNVSALSICDKVTTTCSNPNVPDGGLTPVPGSPFSAGIGPSAISTDATGMFLYVVDQTSNQISQFKVSTGTGAITALSPAAVSTGTTPFGLTVITGTTLITATGGTIEYLYVTNNGSTTVSTYSFDSTLGALGVLGMPTPTISGNPTGIAGR